MEMQACLDPGLSLRFMRAITKLPATSHFVVHPSNMNGTRLGVFIA